MHRAFSRRAAAAIVGLAVALAAPLAVAAQDFPVKPITLVVPQGAGSGSDVVARLIAAHMTEALDQPVVVENRTGGGGIVAHQSVMTAQPDGYTILFSSTAQMLVVPAINEAADYKLDDFTPVAPVLRAPFALLVANTPDAPASVEELVEMLREGQQAFASAGVGTMTHLGSEIFLRRAGVEATHIPYRGSGAALADLIGGHVLFATDSLTASLSHIRSGSLRVLAVTGATREASLPDVPTLAEASLPGEPIAVIGGLFAPKGLDGNAAERLRQVVEETLNHPEVVEQFAAIETGILRISNEEFLDRLRTDEPVWQALADELDLQID